MSKHWFLSLVKFLSHTPALIYLQALVVAKLCHGTFYNIILLYRLLLYTFPFPTALNYICDKAFDNHLKKSQCHRFCHWSVTKFLYAFPWNEYKFHNQALFQKTKTRRLFYTVCDRGCVKRHPFPYIICIRMYAILCTHDATSNVWKCSAKTMY